MKIKSEKELEGVNLQIW